MTSPAAQEDHYCHARMISRLHLWTHPGLLYVYISHQSPSLWMMKAASLLGHLRATGRVLRNPSESCRLPSAHSENSWHQSIWWTFDLLEGPCTCNKLKTEWLIGCFCSQRISWFMVYLLQMWSFGSQSGIDVSLVQQYLYWMVFREEKLMKGKVVLCCVVPCPILDNFTVGMDILICIIDYYSSTIHYVILKADSDKNI